MSFRRQPLLVPEDEAILREQLLPLWNNKKRIKAKKIAEILQFGVAGTKFAKVRKDYVWFYREKFNHDESDENKEFFGKFPPRRKGPFARGQPRYKVGHPKYLGLMSVEEFEETLNANCPPIDIRSKMIRAYLIIHYFSPLRLSEVLERVLKDFEITPKNIIIHLLRKKKKVSKKRKKEDESINFRRTFPLVNEIISYLAEWENNLSRKKKKTKLTERPFNFCGVTALKYVKKVFGEDYFLHYFRFNYITEEANQPGTSMLKLKEKTKLTPQIIDNYLMSLKKTEDEVDDSREARYRKRGVIT